MVFTLTYEENKKIDEGLRKLEDLSGKISDLTCKGLFFGKNGALKLEKDRIKITKILVVILAGVACLLFLALIMPPAVMPIHERKYQIYFSNHFGIG